MRRIYGRRDGRQICGGHTADMRRINGGYTADMRRTCGVHAPVRLADSEGEAADQSVTPLLAAIGEKPRIVEVRRFGIFKVGYNRPVQLTVGSSSVASQLIRKGKLFKSSVDFRGVYLGSDRTPAEREECRKLVVRRRTEKTNAESDSGVRYLRSGRKVNLPTQ